MRRHCRIDLISRSNGLKSQLHRFPVQYSYELLSTLGPGLQQWEVRCRAHTEQKKRRQTSHIPDSPEGILGLQFPFASLLEPQFTFPLALSRVCFHPLACLLPYLGLGTGHLKMCLNGMLIILNQSYLRHDHAQETLRSSCFPEIRKLISHVKGIL